MDARKLADAAELSEASYRSLVDEELNKPFIDASKLKKALITKYENEGFSDSQADTFLNKWDVIHQTDIPTINLKVLHVYESSKDRNIIMHKKTKIVYCPHPFII